MSSATSPTLSPPSSRRSTTRSRTSSPRVWASGCSGPSATSRRSPALVAAPDEDLGPVGARPPRELLRGAGLADAGLAGEHDHAALAGARRGQGRAERRQLMCPADERPAAGVRHVLQTLTATGSGCLETKSQGAVLRTAPHHGPAGLPQNRPVAIRPKVRGSPGDVA